MTETYRELHRPQFHFSARKNWINDPNGLVFQDGTWHLYFQHNPKSTVWGNMTWGHAVSDDLIHWKQLDHAMYPDEHGTMFSGSAVIDHENTAGFGAGAIVFLYTAAGRHVDPTREFTQCLAWSTDNGMTLTKYEGNPVLEWIEGDNRDPKVSWHEASGKWIMPLYLADDRYSLYGSKDLKSWSHLQDLRLEGDRECPDFFPLKDESGEERWVFWGANGFYQVGRFDGTEFMAETPVLACENGRNGYAAQTWSNVPDGRCIQISWMAGGHFPEMPFNHQMSIPVTLELVGSGRDVLLRRWPVREVKSLRVREVRLASTTIEPGSPIVPDTAAKLMDVSFTVKRGDRQALIVNIRGQALTFNWDKNEMRFAAGQAPGMVKGRKSTQLPDGDLLDVRLLIDRTSVEVFLNGGEVSASYCFLPSAYEHPLLLQSWRGNSELEQLELFELRSIWE
ncbi:MAG: 2,6-beta-D-fructofuranosidase [Gammaproteobacteria bacterium]|nr:2,6-beta-D-fructofuranosidase [Gammaproteobacteria bacterium]